MSHRSLTMAAVGLAFLFSGCSVDVSTGGDQALTQTELEERLSDGIELDDPEMTTDVSCEGGLAAEEGATQDCLLSYGEDQGRIGMRVTSGDDEAREIDHVLFLSGDDFADAAVPLLQGEGFSEVEADCSGELIGEVDETIECDVVLDGEEATATGTVTSVEDLMINFTISYERQ